MHSDNFTLMIADVSEHFVYVRHSEACFPCITPVSLYKIPSNEVGRDFTDGEPRPGRGG